MAGLREATARIAEELNSQYVLGYTSPRATDGKYHSIRVRVTRPATGCAPATATSASPNRGASEPAHRLPRTDARMKGANPHFEVVGM